MNIKIPKVIKGIREDYSTREGFLRAATTIHKEHPYTYSYGAFTNIHEDITVTCPVHGEWVVNAKKHLATPESHYCTICKIQDRKNRRAQEKEQKRLDAIERARSISVEIHRPRSKWEDINYRRFKKKKVV